MKKRQFTASFPCLTELSFNPLIPPLMYPEHLKELLTKVRHCQALKGMSPSRHIDQRLKSRSSPHTYYREKQPARQYQFVFLVNTKRLTRKDEIVNPRVI